MKLVVLTSFLIAVAFLSAGCGRDGRIPEYTGQSGPLGIIFDSTVPANQAAMLSADLQALERVQLPTSNSQYTQYVGISDFSAGSVTNWLKARVRLIVGETFDYKRSARAGEQRKYNPTILSRSQDELSESSDIKTVMFNVGSLVYLTGKEESRVYTMTVGASSFPVKTPRVGIIQIGEGLFTVNAIPKSSLDSVANRYLRAAVLFHEARHTDGNGVTAAMPHSLCTTGDYKDSYSCESNLNGPYIVEAVMLRQFYDACGSGCSYTELDGMRSFIADNVSRLLSGASFKDDRPEAIE